MPIIPLNRPPQNIDFVLNHPAFLDYLTPQDMARLQCCKSLAVDYQPRLESLKKDT